MRHLKTLIWEYTPCQKTDLLLYFDDLFGSAVERPPYEQEVPGSIPAGQMFES